MVAGGPGAWIGLVARRRPLGEQTYQLPPNWDRLVRKYRDWVPNYLRYWWCSTSTRSSSAAVRPA